MTRALCPGSYDPFTNGHLDIIERAARIFDQVVVGIPVNSSKQPLFSYDEREEMIREVAGHLPNITVTQIPGLLVEAVRASQCSVIIRGMRAVMDFEYEYQMSMMNKKLAPDLETIFLVTSPQFTYISSTLVKEVARNGGSLDGVVPPTVAQRLRSKFPQPTR